MVRLVDRSLLCFHPGPSYRVVLHLLPINLIHFLKVFFLRSMLEICVDCIIWHEFNKSTVRAVHSIRLCASPHNGWVGMRSQSTKWDCARGWPFGFQSSNVFFFQTVNLLFQSIWTTRLLRINPTQWDPIWICSDFFLKN